MSESMRMWVEIGFNITYLVVVWALIIAMLRNRDRLAPQNRTVGQLFLTAFVLLATGDVGHVGFRVLAYARGEIGPGGSGVSPLVGLGALATAITVTFFYAVMLYIWRARFGKPFGILGGVLLAAAAARLVIMAFPQNQWSAVVPPYDWSLARNIPLMVQGFGVAYLIFRDAIARGDALFKGIGTCILVSFGFYLPVILFVQQVPVIGMLMIPKTIAYVAIAWLAYTDLYPRKQRSEVRVTA